MKRDDDGIKRVIKIIYIMAAVFIAIGIYMYAFDITSHGGAMARRRKQDNAISGDAVIIVGVLMAISAAILHYRGLKKKHHH